MTNDTPASPTRPSTEQQLFRTLNQLVEPVVRGGLGNSPPAPARTGDPAVRHRGTVARAARSLSIRIWYGGSHIPSLLRA